ncbi:hypothetical protein PDJAM_G00209100 [Pangasius djambal]|uniref:Uncharacterized protein n=1 Tax=Pangasius djambal TaxID=1691987 RepID=A0ACC5Y9F3_9TELE|nr:hypothetical protein [Pangasius djambal]
MTSPAGPQSHFRWRWTASSSRAGVFLNGSPGEVGSVRSSCSSPGVDASLEDSFSAQFAPLPVSRSSSCLSVDSMCPSQSGRAPGPTPPSSQVHTGLPAARNPQALIHRLQELKQLQQCMQEQLKAHQQEQLQKLQNEQSMLLGMVQTATEYDNTKQPSLKTTEQPEQSGSKSSHTIPRVSPVQHVHQQPKEVDRTLEPGVWNQEPDVDQASSGHHSDDDYDREEESLQPEDTNMCQKDSETEPHDRPIRSGGGGKTFEEMLEEQLKLENEKLSKISGAPTDAAKVKRPFLRRGEGLSRFTRGQTTGSFRDRATSSDTKPTPVVNPSAFHGPTIRSHQSAEPKRTSPKSISTTNIVTQRKTAVLNKNNFPQKTSVPVTKALAKAHVHGGHQNVRVEGQNVNSGPVQHLSKSNNKPEGQKVLSDIMVDISKGASRQYHNMDEQSARIAENSFEVWLKERGEHWERDHHREHVELGEFELLERAADEFSFSSNSSFINTLLRRDGRRLSSTPVKSPPKSSVPDRCLDVGTGLNKAHSPTVPPVDSVAVMEGTSTQPDEVMTECSGDEDVEDSDSSLCSNTVFHQPAIVQNLQEPFRFQASALPYDKRSYQDRDRAGSPEGEEESHRDSTLVDTRGQVEFDDDDTWNEPENSTCTPAKMDDQADRVLKRKIAISKGAELDHCCNSPLDHEPEPPPTCQLVAKLFPALKPKPCPPPPELPDSDRHSEQGAARSTLLRERLVELEIEIERFRKENAALSRLRQENQEFQETLRKEREKFQQNMADERAKWEEFKLEEGRKLQREKKLFEKHAAAARARPDKQERDEIQSLKQQLNTLQEDLRKREARWTSTHSRLRQQIDTLSAENATLRDQVRTLEKLRLTTWKNAESEQERERGRSSASSNSSNTRAAKSKSPSSSNKSSPPENSKKMESLEVQNPPKIPAKSASTTCSTDWRKEPCGPLHAPDHLIVSELKSHDPQLIKNSTHSVLEVDSPRGITGKCGLEQEEIIHTDGKIEKMFPDGGRLIVFPNGTRKEVSADGLSVRVTFFNGDIKQIMPDQRVIYYYAEAQTTHTTYPDGMEVLQFPNNQIEKHFTDGHKEITFPDQTVKNLYPDGREESVLIDGTIIQQNPDGTKQIQFNTGQRELHTAEFKRREYPDGTVKTVYSDGRQETRYPTGRVRLKNPEGHVIMDTKA